MNIEVLGYSAFALIVTFSWLQLVFSFRGRTLNLGVWPLVALTVGLAALEVALFFGTATPLYLLIGNGLSLVGTFVNLLRVSIFKPRINPHVSSALEKYAEQTLRANTFDISTFFNFIKRRKGTPQPMGNTVDFAAMSPLNAVEPSPYVEKHALQDCKTCGCLLYEERSTPVAVCMFDIGFVIAREGKTSPPYESMVHPLRYDYYCKRDRPAYDRVVYVPQLNGSTFCEYFQQTMSDVEFWNMKNAHGAAFTPSEPFRQVTEDGQQYD